MDIVTRVIKNGPSACYHLVTRVSFLSGIYSGLSLDGIFNNHHTDIAVDSVSKRQDEARYTRPNEDVGRVAAAVNKDEMLIFDFSMVRGPN